MPKENKSARNRAAVDYLRALQHNGVPKVTYDQLSERSGIPKDTINNIMRNKADLTMDWFTDLAEHLGASPAEAFAALSEIFEKHPL